MSAIEASHIVVSEIWSLLHWHQIVSFYYWGIHEFCHRMTWLLWC